MLGAPMRCVPYPPFILTSLLLMTALTVGCTSEAERARALATGTSAATAQKDVPGAEAEASSDVSMDELWATHRRPNHPPTPSRRAKYAAPKT